MSRTMRKGLPDYLQDKTGQPFPYPREALEFYARFSSEQRDAALATKKKQSFCFLCIRKSDGLVRVVSSLHQVQLLTGLQWKTARIAAVKDSHWVHDNSPWLLSSITVGRGKQSRARTYKRWSDWDVKMAQRVDCLVVAADKDNDYFTYPNRFVLCKDIHITEAMYFNLRNTYGYGVRSEPFYSPYLFKYIYFVFFNLLDDDYSEEHNQELLAMQKCWDTKSIDPPLTEEDLREKRRLSRIRPGAYETERVPAYEGRHNPEIEKGKVEYGPEAPPFYRQAQLAYAVDPQHWFEWFDYNLLTDDEQTRMRKIAGEEACDMAFDRAEEESDKRLATVMRLPLEKWLDYYQSIPAEPLRQRLLARLHSVQVDDPMQPGQKISGRVLMRRILAEYKKPAAQLEVVDDEPLLPIPESSPKEYTRSAYVDKSEDDDLWED